MTWFMTDNGYQLFFNRDERNTRSRAELPAVKKLASGGEYISPTDVDAGGTWIAVNNLGVTVCLLNHYQFEQIASYQKWTSRGEIVRQFANTDSLVSANNQFSKLSLENFRAFRMFILEPTGNNCLFIWDGHTPKVQRNVTAPKSSSSVDSKQVKLVRKQYFKDLKLSQSNNVNDYIAYHAQHYPEQPKNSVCMHREGGSTVSLSHICVNESQVDFYYADGSPCQVKLEKTASIARQSDHITLVMQTFIC